MQLLPDFYSMLRELSWATLALIVGGVVYAIYRLLVWWLSGLLASHGKAVEQIGTLYESASEVMSEIRALHTEVITLMAEVKSRCGTESCPMVLVLKKHLVENDKFLQESFQRAKDDRHEINEQLKNIYTRINDFVNELGREMIRALRNGRDKGGD